MFALWRRTYVEVFALSPGVVLFDDFSDGKSDLGIVIGRLWDKCSPLSPTFPPKNEPGRAYLLSTSRRVCPDLSDFAVSANAITITMRVFALSAIIRASR
jgi:hypothetical protein